MHLPPSSTLLVASPHSDWKLVYEIYLGLVLHHFETIDINNLSVSRPRICGTKNKLWFFQRRDTAAVTAKK